MKSHTQSGNIGVLQRASRETRKRRCQGRLIFESSQVWIKPGESKVTDQSYIALVSFRPLGGGIAHNARKEAQFPK